MREDAFVGILLDLIHCLSYIYTTSLQFDMYNRHTVNEQHHIATSCSAKRMLGLESWLTNNLINTLSCMNLTSIEDSEIHLLAEVDLVIRIVTLYHHLTTVDELVHLVWVLQSVHLCHDLLHLSVGEFKVTKTIHVTIIIEYDSCPVFNEDILCWVHNYIRLPTMLWQEVCKCLLKIKFLQERTN